MSGQGVSRGKGLGGRKAWRVSVPPAAWGMKAPDRRTLGEQGAIPLGLDFPTEPRNSPVFKILTDSTGFMAAQTGSSSMVFSPSRSCQANKRKSQGSHIRGGERETSLVSLSAQAESVLQQVSAGTVLDIHPGPGLSSQGTAGLPKSPFP